MMITLATVPSQLLLAETLDGNPLREHPAGTLDPSTRLTIVSVAAAAAFLFREAEAF